MSFARRLNGLSAVPQPEQGGTDARRLCEHAGEIGMVVDAEAVGNEQPALGAFGIEKPVHLPRLYQEHVACGEALFLEVDYAAARAALHQSEDVVVLMGVSNGAVFVPRRVYPPQTDSGSGEQR